MHLKPINGFECLRLRGPSVARDEFHLDAIIQNLKTMALRLSTHRRTECLRQLERKCANRGLPNTPLLY